MKRATVIGGRGFVGSHLVEALRNDDFSVFVPLKDDPTLFDTDLGTVFFCAGYGRCDLDPFKVAESNVSALSKVLQESNFTRLIYLSSTRVYMEGDSSSETSDITTLTDDKRRLFNLTKLVAEELCLSSAKDTVILRPSNIYGLAMESPLYLPSIVRNAINDNVVNMYVSKTYAKDYLSVFDLCRLLIRISESQFTNYSTYNVGSGRNTSSEEIAQILHSYTGCNVVWHENSSDDEFPVTDISRIKDEFGFDPSCVLSDLPKMIASFKNALCMEADCG